MQCRGHGNIVALSDKGLTLSNLCVVIVLRQREKVLSLDLISILCQMLCLHQKYPYHDPHRQFLLFGRDSELDKCTSNFLSPPIAFMMSAALS